MVSSLAELRAFEPILRHEEPLARHTTFRIGGPARFFALPRTQEELIALMRRLWEMQLHWRILGGGSNVLAGDVGFDGVAVSLRCLQPMRLLREGDILIASGGASLSSLVRHAAEEGLSGMEPFAGIPGTVGGALRMNAGPKDVGIGTRVKWVEMLLPAGQIERVPAERIEWRYRHAQLPPGAIAVAAAFALKKGTRAHILDETRNWLARKRATQPLSRPSAGCVFRNPEGACAGELIERAGAKGKRIGGAQVSRKHANFIVNVGGATASDVCQLIRYVQQIVLDQIGVRLQPEIDIWPEAFLEKESRQ